jgi:hypothetical protein
MKTNASRKKTRHHPNTSWPPARPATFRTARLPFGRRRRRWGRGRTRNAQGNGVRVQDAPPARVRVVGLVESRRHRKPVLGLGLPPSRDDLVEGPRLRHRQRVLRRARVRGHLRRLRSRHDGQALLQGRALLSTCRPTTAMHEGSLPRGDRDPRRAGSVRPLRAVRRPQRGLQRLQIFDLFVDRAVAARTGTGRCARHSKREGAADRRSSRGTQARPRLSLGDVGGDGVERHHGSL